MNGEARPRTKGLAPVVLGALVLLLALTPATDAKRPTCKRKKESRGCRLPAGSSYTKTIPRGYVNLVAGRSFLRVLISGPLTCAGGRVKGVYLNDTIHRTPKVGSSYTLNANDISGAIGVFDRTKGTVRLASAGKATVALTYTHVVNGAPDCVAPVRGTLTRTQ